MNKKPNFYRDTWFQIWRNLSQRESLVNLTVEFDIVEWEEHWTVKKLEMVKTVAKPDILQLVLPGTMIERIAGQVGGPNC